MNTTLISESGQDVIYVQFKGTVDLERLKQDVKNVICRPTYEEGCHVILDLCDVKLDLRSLDMFAFEEYFHRCLNGEKAAWSILADTNNSPGYEVLCTWQSIARSVGDEIYITPELNDAKHWFERQCRIISKRNYAE